MMSFTVEMGKSGSWRALQARYVFPLLQHHTLTARLMPTASMMYRLLPERLLTMMLG
jgi:hypothetical protein